MSDPITTDFDELIDNLDPDDPKPWRAHAKEVTTANKALQQQLADKDAKIAQYEKREAFEAAVAQAGELKVPVTFDEFGDLPANLITPEIIRGRANDKATADAATRLAAAKSAGFETVEAYDEALAEIKAKRAEQQQNMQTATNIVAGGGNASAPPEKPQAEVVTGAFAEARKKGKNTKDARADAIGALVETATTKKE